MVSLRRRLPEALYFRWDRVDVLRNLSWTFERDVVSRAAFRLVTWHVPFPNGPKIGAKPHDAHTRSFWL